MHSKFLAAGFAALAFTLSVAAASGPIGRVLDMPQASLLVEESGADVIARNPDRPMVPASTMKLITALAAIDHWGLDHHFHTDFFVDDHDRLWVRGSGDPFLVSEELDRIAAGLKAAGIERLSGIATDDGFFAPTLEVAGRSSSNNPYDAPLSSLSANFNTINVRVGPRGVESAEPQTPITPLARSLAAGLPQGKHRINLGKRELAPRYFAELLAVKLGTAGIDVPQDAWIAGTLPKSARPVYRHQNSRDLRALIDDMLEYSNNFIANHLFLLMADRGKGESLTMKAAQQAMAAWVDRTFGWRGYRIEEGAGLSRGNRISARQLVQVVRAFDPYRDLLPQEGEGVFAKTGTLTGVSTLAGYVRRSGRWVPFALMINQPVDYGLRLQVAAALTREPDLSVFCPAGAC